MEIIRFKKTKRFAPYHFTIWNRQLCTTLKVYTVGKLTSKNSKFEETPLLCTVTVLASVNVSWTMTALANLLIPAILQVQIEHSGSQMHITTWIPESRRMLRL